MKSRSLPCSTSLAAAVVAAFGLCTPSWVGATTRLVINCDDAGPGSLRATVAVADDGDTVSLSGLYCPSSVISLTTGAVVVPQNNLTIAGDSSVALVGKYDRVFDHKGVGTLTLTDVIVGPATAAPSSYGYAQGGCIRSYGTVSVYGSLVNGCVAEAPYGNAYGGAIFALGNVNIKYSQVSDSTGSAHYAGGVYGGGVFAFGELKARYSTISGNQAKSANGKGGGVLVLGNVTLDHVTMAGNSAGLEGGALYRKGSGAGSVTIRSSTISGNQSAFTVGGLHIESTPSVTIANSTIAFNSSAYGFYGAGLNVRTGVGPGASNVNLKLQSTLISNNKAGASDLDFAGISLAPKSVTFDQASSANFIRVPSDDLLPPAGTLVVTCPLLGPLRDNGGGLPTHALMSGSAAIDSGSNPNDESQDQRGIGTNSSLYPRISKGASDIGAYEINQADTIFSSGLDGCTPAD